MVDHCSLLNCLVIAVSWAGFDIDVHNTRII